MAPPAAAPHIAAPAPHFAAPRPAAPHFAAPHVAPQPHIAAPRVAPSQQHFSARTFAAPRASAPHFSAPHVAAPRNAPQHALRQMTARPGPHFARSNVGPRPSVHAAREIGRHVAAPAARPSRPGPEQRLAGQRGGEQRLAPGAPRTVGQSPNRATTAATTGATGNLSRAEQARLAKAAPIIRNPVFASQSSRGAASSLAQLTFRGRFAHSGLGRHFDRRRVGIVLGFVGPLFWPYAYDDFVDYTFSPYAYDTFWPYAFDDVLVGIYGGYAPEYYAPEDAYAYAGAPASVRAYSRAATEPPRSASSGALRICSGQAQGVTDFSIQKIAQQVAPDRRQQELLDELKAATVKAVSILQAACPTDLPSTSTGRLAAMRARVDAMLRAVQIVRPKLDKFYQSLSDEQRVRFNALDQGEQASRAQRSDLARLCDDKAASASGLPIDRIERRLHLSPGQAAGLKELDQASLKVAETMKLKCQPTETLTPTGRLAAMEERLSAMSQALATAQAALTRFYGSLSDEQKAQFDRLNVRAT
jgi:hypothetical protein